MMRACRRDSAAVWSDSTPGESPRRVGWLRRFVSTHSGALAERRALRAARLLGDDVSSFTNSDSGRSVKVSAGTKLQITLASIGTQGDPAVSSSAVVFDGSSVIPPFTPAGPTLQYRFHAAGAGQATIIIPFLNPANPPPFTLDVSVN